MRTCKQCGRSWEEESHGAKCPFCGYVPEAETKPRGIAETLRSLMEEHGVEIIHQPKRFYALLSDTLTGHEQEKALVRHVILDSGCYAEMAANNSEADGQKTACMQRNAALLENKYFMSRENAVKALVWMCCFSVKSFLLGNKSCGNIGRISN